MKHIISMVVVAALVAVGVVEAKHEVRPEMPVRPVEIRPVEMKVEGKKEMHKKAKHHGQKHHTRPHGKRCHKHGVRPMHHKGMKRSHRKPMMDAPIVRPVRKHVMRKPEMNAPIVRPVRKACPAIKRVG